MAMRKVNTATLIRGEIYTLRHPKSTPTHPKDSLRFEHGKPVVIEDLDVLKILEDLYDTTIDGDGEEFEKPTFHVQRGVQAPDDDLSNKPKRLSSSRAVKRKPLRRA